MGCASDACTKTGSKSQQCPRDRQEEKAELCSAAVPWQQITGNLKHWCLSNRERADGVFCLFTAVPTQTSKAIFSLCVNCVCEK